MSPIMNPHATDHNPVAPSSLSWIAGKCSAALGSRWGERGGSLLWTYTGRF
jgi:hypothetical protein